MKVERILVVFILFMIPFLGFQCGKSLTVPDHLIGVWETTDTSYADKPFEIRREEVIFHTGGDNFDTYPIKKIEVESAPQKPGNLYIIHYKILEGKVYKFSFYYNQTGKGEIIYKNQPEIVWTKKSES
jgi:hypothetical protein